MKNKEKFDLTKLDFVKAYNEKAQCVKVYFDNGTERTLIDTIHHTEGIKKVIVAMQWLEQEYSEKPLISEKEVDILESLLKKYKYITRSLNGYLYIHTIKPTKYGGHWTTGQTQSEDMNLAAFDHLFQFVKWENSEPYFIDDLINQFINTNTKKESRN